MRTSQSHGFLAGPQEPGEETRGEMGLGCQAGGQQARGKWREVPGRKWPELPCGGELATARLRREEAEL